MPADGTLTMRTRPQRIFHGWWVAAVCFLANFSSVGFSSYAFGLFITPLTAEFGWSRAEINAAISFTVFSGFVGPLLGVLMDRRGPRMVMLVSLPLVGLGYLLRFGVHDLWQFYALSAMTALAQAGEASLTTPVLVSNWFVRLRGRVMGLALMGANIGGLVIPPITVQLIDHLGWRSTYVGFSFIPLLVTLPLTVFLVRDRPDQLGERAFGAEKLSSPPVGRTAGAVVDADQAWPLGRALRTRTFWLLSAVFFISSLSFITVLTQLVPHLEREGIDRGFASGVLAILALFGAVGKLLFGYLAERIPPRRVLILSYVLQTAGILLLLQIHWGWTLAPFVPLFGLGYGSVGVLFPLLVTESFGAVGFGKLFALLSLSGTAAGMIGAPLAGAIFDATSHYDPAFAGLIVLYFAGIGCMLAARPTKPYRAQAV